MLIYKLPFRMQSECPVFHFCGVVYTELAFTEKEKTGCRNRGKGSTWKEEVDGTIDNHLLLSFLLSKP